MHQLRQWSRFGSDLVGDLVTAGPLYAIARHRIHAPAPLDPAENWHFWTQPRPAWLTALLRHTPPAAQRRAYLTARLAADQASGIEAHYDVSNDFYALFLDSRYRFYTCADFLSAADTLETAQTRKADYLRALLRLSGEETILDLGCGWGAMLAYLRDSGHRGHLRGLTLSREQWAYSRQTLGLDVALANFVTDPFDMGGVEGGCDRILSIGALEHVRPAELSALYQKMYAALRPGGLAVHQFFSFEREPYPASAIALQLFFPGSLLVLHHHHRAAATEAGFSLTHDSTHDYQPTIKAWYDRLVHHREAALALVGLETYNRYMTFFPIAWLFFQHNEAKLHRLVMEKPLE